MSRGSRSALVFALVGAGLLAVMAWPVWIITTGKPCWLLGNASVICWLVRGDR